MCLHFPSIYYFAGQNDVVPVGWLAGRLAANRGLCLWLLLLLHLNPNNINPRVIALTFPMNFLKMAEFVHFGFWVLARERTCDSVPFILLLS